MKTNNYSICSLNHVKAFFFAFFLPFGLRYINIWKINVGLFSIHWICPPSFILCLCSFSFLSLLFLSNISNTHTPTLEGANPIKSGPQQMSPQCGAMIDDVLNMGQQQMPTKMGLTTYDTLYGVWHWFLYPFCKQVISF